MSRYQIQTPGGQVAYGFDHACGPFLQVWLDSQPDEPAEDVCYAFSEGHRFDCHALAARLRDMLPLFAAVGASVEQVKQHIDALWLDLPI